MRCIVSPRRLWISSPSSAQIEEIMLNCRDSCDLNGQRLHMAGKIVTDILTAGVNYLLAQQTAPKPKLTTIFCLSSWNFPSWNFHSMLLRTLFCFSTVRQLFSLLFLKGAVVITIRCVRNIVLFRVAIFGSQVGVKLLSIVQNSIEKIKSVGRNNSCTGNPKNGHFPSPGTFYRSQYKY